MTQVKIQGSGGTIPDAVLQRVEELERELERGWSCFDEVCIKVRVVLSARVARHGGGYTVTFYLSDYRIMRAMLDSNGEVKKVVVY